ncbi:MAG TPA: hypothetical protein VME22_14280 [Solirubrobacteraceae bacterium]|nr:hypothetical protein [Solirubrobacteraceae bacterium]
MVPQLIARVDGLPEVLLDREVVWPASHDSRDRDCRSLTAKRRARIERQTAVVHAAAVSSAARAVLEEATVIGSPYLEAELERLEIQALLAGVGVL